MESFLDANGGTVRISFKPHSFHKQPEHVFIICKMGKQWLLTNHSKRGLEFPGGKVEIGESLEGAARREALEETGAVIKDLQWIGEYEVIRSNTSFVKAIFFGNVEKLEEKGHYYETNGPVLIDGDILTRRWAPEYSFIMKDAVVEKSINRILEKNGMV
ncbi:nucleoside triphosphatase YtkD [Cytobacillus depressus]|uniref:Nucleoside triphosphatase YtkD n=1 Tax=Cytobacillus depressus TaxID=1602942 RepID=A0A6L3VDA0_9BACI|nr:nucleoside triphosphatase YtkD [Cytobacillus depressus]KAB2338909.1 nucleoside triphosphatase YtkD [Cytobacillus depressus]